MCDSLVPFPSDYTDRLVEVFWLAGAGAEAPFVCGVHGGICSNSIAEIEDQIAEDNIEETLQRGDGRYLFRVKWIEPELGEYDRVYLPGYWDLTLLRFQSLEESVKEVSDSG